MSEGAPTDDLDRALGRLERALAAPRGAPSFDGDADGPERELRRALAAMLPEALAAPRSLAELVDDLRVAVRVETRVEGRLVASTAVGIGGDLTLAAAPAPAPADHALHLRSLGEALAIRRARMRLLCGAIQAAARIAVAVGTANPLLALPAAWRFVRAVLDEDGARAPAPPSV